jgi:nicotinate-nucleotide pyrophosphorylase
MITDAELLRLLQEDVPYFDLTTHALGITSQPAHIQFLGRDPQVKEKKILVEVKRVADALHLAKAGIDGIQLDKLPVSELQNCVQQIRQINPQLLILATGGIAKHNITDYAATGVDGLVTTAPYYADPADIGVKLTPWEA